MQFPVAPKKHFGAAPTAQAHATALKPPEFAFDSKLCFHLLFGWENVFSILFQNKLSVSII